MSKNLYGLIQEMTVCMLSVNVDLDFGSVQSYYKLLHVAYATVYVLNLCINATWWVSMKLL